MSIIRVRSSKPRTKPKADNQCQWQFVNISESKQATDADLRKVVRVNAMRDYRRREKHRLMSTPPPKLNCYRKVPAVLSNPAALRAEADDDDSMWLQSASNGWPSEWEQALSQVESTMSASFPLRTRPVQANTAAESDENINDTLCNKQSSVWQHNGASPILMLGSGNKDPFNSYPIRNGPRHSELLSHCKYSPRSPLLGPHHTSAYPLLTLMSPQSRERDGPQKPPRRPERCQGQQPPPHYLDTYDNDRSRPLPSYRQFRRGSSRYSPRVPESIQHFETENRDNQNDQPEASKCARSDNRLDYWSCCAVGRDGGNMPYPIISVRHSTEEALTSIDVRE